MHGYGSDIPGTQVTAAPGFLRPLTSSGLPRNPSKQDIFSVSYQRPDLVRSVPMSLNCKHRETTTGGVIEFLDMQTCRKIRSQHITSQKLKYQPAQIAALVLTAPA